MLRYTKELHEFLANNLDVSFSSIAIDGEVYTPSDIYSMLLGEISRLQAENRWIPVSERLPEVNGEYILRNLHGVFIDCFENGKFVVSDNDREWAGHELFGITHWRPLPPAPEGEG